MKKNTKEIIKTLSFSIFLVSVLIGIIHGLHELNRGAIVNKYELLSCEELLVEVNNTKIESDKNKAVMIELISYYMARCIDI